MKLNPAVSNRFCFNYVLNFFATLYFYKGFHVYYLKFPEIVESDTSTFSFSSFFWIWDVKIWICILHLNKLFFLCFALFYFIFFAAHVRKGNFAPWYYSEVGAKKLCWLNSLCHISLITKGLGKYWISKGTFILVMQWVFSLVHG